MESCELNGRTLEYDDDTHTYFVEGVIVPSVTQLLNRKFGHKYDGIPKETLKSAAERGTLIHKVVEEWCKNRSESDIRELRDFQFLQNRYDFAVCENEIPIILDIGGKTYAGRLDMIIELKGLFAVADIKTTSSLDKEYLGHQLNLYRIGYEQSYGKHIDTLYGIHLKDGTRKLVEIPIKEEEWLLKSLELTETE